MSVGNGLSADHPFPGLRSFTYDDRDYFFGREEQTYALYNLLELSQFVAVVGSSGSGKSSLVRAGLLPLLISDRDGELTSGEIPIGRAWRWIELHPGDAPLSSIGEKLAEAAVPESRGTIERAARRERIDYALRRASFGMTEVLADIDALQSTTLLIVVDQFEELFRYAGSGPPLARQQAERDQFVQLLLEATTGRDIDVRVLITMRSDFIGDCARFAGLPEAVSTCQFLVPSLTRLQREEVIRHPLDEAHANSPIEPALVERLLNDAGGDLDELPVLQHCLSRLWEVAGPSRPTPPHRHLRQEHYAAIGSFAEALSCHADEVLAGLDAHNLAVEQVFRALCEIDNEGRATRRALQYGNLRAETGIGDEELRLVVDRFRADDCSFLVPSMSAIQHLADEATVDIGHEALLRRWKKIGSERHETGAGWLEAEANDGRIYRALLAIREGGRTLPLDQVEARWTWWNERPRTSAWAERYGGHLEQVRSLFEDSRGALADSREREVRQAKAVRRARAAAIGIGLISSICVFGVLVTFYFYQRTQIQQLENVQTQLYSALSEREKAVDDSNKSKNELQQSNDNLQSQNTQLEELKKQLLAASNTSQQIKALGAQTDIANQQISTLQKQLAAAPREHSDNFCGIAVTYALFRPPADPSSQPDLVGVWMGNWNGLITIPCGALIIESAPRSGMLWATYQYQLKTGETDRFGVTATVTPDGTLTFIDPDKSKFTFRLIDPTHFNASYQKKESGSVLLTGKFEKIR